MRGCCCRITAAGQVAVLAAPGYAAGLGCSCDAIAAASCLAMVLQCAHMHGPHQQRMQLQL